jgi:transcriptional regulator with XRE-family HTH domain
MLLRKLLGDALRRQRQHQSRTLRDVSADASVSLGYLSEVERGQKEASSELLSSICEALGVHLSDVLREVSDELRLLESAESQGLTALIAMPDDASALTVGMSAADGDRSVGHPLGAAEPAESDHEARASGDRVVVAA